MTLPILYARAKTGKLKQWLVTVVESTITVTHGQVGGKQQEQVTVITEGKNLGRANETTPAEQALSEAKSKWNKQLDRDYRANIEDIPTSTLPPLAYKFQDHGDSLGSEYDVLGKLDGVRCTMFHKDGKVRFQTRGGKDYPVIKEIADELYEKVWKTHPDYVVDGELYCHHMYLEDIVSAVKKHNNDTSKLKFYVFDMFDPDKPEMVWEERYSLYQTLLGGTPKRLRLVSPIHSERVTSEEQMVALHSEFVGWGYEGVVLRKLGATFKFGFRTNTFLKYKVPLDEEFKVIGFEVDKLGCAVPICYIDNQVDPERAEFKSPLIGTREYQQGIARNQEKYIGRYLKVVFETYSKKGVPLKPKGHVFRAMDEDGNPIE